MLRTERAATMADREFFDLLLIPERSSRYKMSRKMKMIIYKDNAIQLGLWAVLGFIVSPWLGATRITGLCAGVVCGLTDLLLMEIHFAYMARRISRQHRERARQAANAGMIERVELNISHAYRVRWRKIDVACLLLEDTSGDLVLVGIDAFGQKTETVPSRIWFELRPLGFGMQNYGGIGPAVAVSANVTLPRNIPKKQPLQNDFIVFTPHEAGRIRQSILPAGR